ncbi:type I-F CRISPR-associated protein Csy1 [Vulcaniibacterium tengchongense]|uniref:CRISPR-associated Csy1 family protein n=1 Tax=Vulcaniibacterium tengchongense TaxID=1273429 RepID=A0A3N4VJ91_9GAMM|nr:type I-F CRISPR-associated protein Csy1 [Vulcaniibacterium tengchongense]RPE79789.1 CRISPR-associated Csy1 family protein [Vulcaniibacterium tengchongense]
MTEEVITPSSRKGRFRSAIAGFIEERRVAKEKDKNYEPAKYEYNAWLADAVRRVGQIQAVTHVLKATHPDARGSSLHVAPNALPQRAEIGSHVLGGNFAEDVVGNAAALDVFKFLKIEVDGRRLLDWMQASDADLKAALCNDQDTAATWMSAFASLVREETEPASHPLAKQLYWLTGEDPCDDAQYHLLQPMFSSTLAQAVHADIQDARFGEANVQARTAFREKKPSGTPYRDYRNLAFRKLGGTKPQNISQLNSERGGLNYLLPSLPPPAWKPSGTHLLKQETAFAGLLRFGGMRELVAELAGFLAANPDPTAQTRNRREALEQAIGQELALFGAAVRGQYPAGWTRAPDCRLPRHQQLWLDPDRTTLAVRSDPAHPEWQADDEAFNHAYESGGWADEVARDFGLWLNAQLRKRSDKLIELGDVEMRHFARQAILDVAWPAPMQRRAAGRAA